MPELYIPILLGTVRQGRYSEHAAKLMLEHVQKLAEVETELIDIRDLGFDFTNEGEDQKNKEFASKVERADAYVIVTPEYNRSFPGSLKHVLDTNYQEYRYKAAGICGVSSGRMGGARAITALQPVLKIMGMYVIRPEVYFSQIKDAYDQDGSVKDQGAVAGYEKQLPKFLEELVRVAKGMRNLRESLKISQK